MLNRQLFVDIRPSSVNGQQLEEMGSSADELLIKVRKPYTITKQRERWTEEEHEKFLEALKLYGRAWRRIQEHIGTKTAIQIRSHAQKFFSKVVRETGTEKSVEIPPPRPKRKPLHPYPRKLAHMYSKGIPVVKQHDSASLPFTSGSEQDSGSPVSVLSGVGSETVASVVSNPPNSCTLSLPSAVGSEPDESLLGEQESGCFSHSTSNTEDDTMSSPGLASHGLIKQDETPMELDSNHVSSEEISPPGQSTCLKLFGKTVLVEESQNRSSSPVGKPQCLSDGTNEKIVGLDMPTQLCSMFGKQNESIGIPENCSWSQWHNGISPLYYCLTPNYYQVNSEQSAITPVPFLWTFVGNLQVPVFGKPDIIMKEENPKEVETSNENAHKEGSFTGSKLESTEGVGNDNCDTKSLDSLNYGVPNKPPCTFKLKPSETSAFTLVKASKSDCIAGYMPNNTDVDGEQVQEYSKKNNREDNQSVSCL